MLLYLFLYNFVAEIKNRINKLEILSMHNFLNGKSAAMMLALSLVNVTAAFAQVIIQVLRKRVIVM